MITQKFRKFIPFFKIDEAKREVWGIVTAEVPDKVNEVCDYATTLPYYKETIGEMEKNSDGMNMMPLRVMHQLKTAGKGIGFVPNDAAKEIHMGFKVVDDDEWKKVVERVYTGFSQGGDYMGKWDKDGYTYYTAKPAEVSLVDNPCLGVARFYLKADGACELQKADGSTAQYKSFDTLDASLTDAVRLLNKAGITNMPDGPKSESAEEIYKRVKAELVAAGVLKEAKTKRVAGEDLTAACFAYVGNAEETKTWKLPIKFESAEKTKTHIRNALSRFSSTQGIPADEKANVKAKIVAAAKEHGIEVTEDSKKAVRAALARMLAEPMLAEPKLASKKPADLVKGMWQVGQMGNVLDDLAWLVASTTYERDYEKDESPVPDDLAEALATLIPVFIQMATEEATELIAAPKAAKGGSMFKLFGTVVAALRKMTAEDLKKAAFEPTVADELEKAGKTCHECLDEMHKAVTDHHDDMKKMHEEHAAKCIKAHGAFMEKLHGSIEKIRKAMGAGAPTEQAAGGAVSEGEKALQAELEKTRAEAKKNADQLVELTKQLEAAKAGGGMTPEQLKTITDGIASIAKAQEATEKALKEQADKVEKIGSEIPAHGPEAVKGQVITMGWRGAAGTGFADLGKTGTDGSGFDNSGL